LLRALLILLPFVAEKLACGIDKSLFAVACGSLDVACGMLKVACGIAVC